MKSYRLWAALTLAVMMLVLSGCLNMESKEYRFSVKPDGSGEGKILFNNIVSQDDDGNDVSEADFSELIDGYIEGNAWEEDHPGYNVTGKRLFVEDGKLMGEITFTFTALDSIGFLTFPGCDCAPILYQLGQMDESYRESNGKTMGDANNPSFIAWDSGTKEFAFQTTVLGDMEGTRSLAKQYQEWEAGKK
ncbi:MAG: hypothetical protein ACOZB3_00685 [Calditrichota bacterium]